MQGCRFAISTSKRYFSSENEHIPGINEICKLQGDTPCTLRTPITPQLGLRPPPPTTWATLNIDAMPKKLPQLVSVRVIFLWRICLRF